MDTVEFLVKKYGLSNIDAMIAFDSFFKKYPSGEISKAQFLEEYKDNIMAEAFFEMFDEDGSGTLRSYIELLAGNSLLIITFHSSFYEYIMVKTAPNLDEPEEKLKWIFNAFDKGFKRSRLRLVLTRPDVKSPERHATIPLYLLISNLSGLVITGANNSLL